MNRCAHCFASCDGIFCSLGCASERYALMLEGVKLLDDLVRLVDAAAAARGVRPPGLHTPASPPPKPALPKPVPPEGSTPLFQGNYEHRQPAATALPNGLDPALRSG